MSTTQKISQREARKLRRRVEELERVIDGQRRAWTSDSFPQGVDVGSIEVGQVLEFGGQITAARVFTARQLGHAVVAVPEPSLRKVKFFALPLPKARP